MPPTPTVEDTTKKQPKKRQRKSTATSNINNTTNSSPLKKKAAVISPPNQIMLSGNGNAGPLGSNQCSSPSQQQNINAGNFQSNHGLVISNL